MRGSARARTPLVAAVAVALALAGCGSSGQSDGPGTGGSATPSATTSATTTAGGESAAKAQPAALPLRGGERRVELALPGGHYQPAAPSGGSDDYHCFLLDPRLTSAAYITGVYFQPGNAAIVHHAILYRVTPGQAADAVAKDEASGGKGWTCFGDPGLPSGDGDPVAALNSAPWLAGWAPGTGEQLLGKGLGVPLAAGSRIVLQVHYNLRAGHGSDSSTVSLRLAAGSAHLTAVHTTLLVAPVELPCAPTESGPLCDRSNSMLDLISRFGPGAGATVAGLQLLCGGTSLTAPRAGPTQSCDRRVTTKSHIVAVAGHMHLLGRSITITVDPGTPRERVLFTQPVWNFDDQRAQTLPTPVAIGPGDVLRVSCTHDAGLRTLLPELKGLQPRYVTWGAGTTDEMCLGILLETDG